MANGMISFQKWLKPSQPCNFKNLFLISDSSLNSAFMPMNCKKKNYIMCTEIEVNKLSSRQTQKEIITATSKSSIVVHPIYTSINCT
jgi:hypothetical protein